MNKTKHQFGRCIADGARKVIRLGVLALLAFGVRSAFADTYVDGDERTWTYVTDKTSATVTKVEPARGVIAIPATLGDKPVVSFGTTFKGQENVTRVTIPAGVTAIADQAFLNCKNLKGVTINATDLKSIGYQAFMGCVNLATFVIPNSVTTLGQGVFSGCSALEEVTIGDGVGTLTGVVYKDSTMSCYLDSEDSETLSRKYDNGLFYNCTSLKTINWGKGLKTIGNIAFLGCTALEKVEIPDTVTSVGNHAFYWCENLGEVKIGAKVTTIGRMAFRADGNLTKVTFGDSVTEIGEQAFQDCVNLQNFELPEMIQYLRYRCFAGCSKALTAVSIPTNKDELETELGQGVFSGCSALEEVTIGDTVKTLTGVVYKDSTMSCYLDSEDSETLSRKYDNGLFYNCTSLKTINWGKNVKTIGNVAFLGCTALEKVEIPDTVTSVGNHAFYWCENLGEVKIGAKVATIGRMAFRADANLTKVTFGDSVTEIGEQTFQDCVNLQNFELPETIQYLRYRCFAGCSKALTAVSIPTNKDELETELEQGVFSGCTKLATVTLGDTVKTLTGVVYKDSTMSCYLDSADSETLSRKYDNGLFYNCTSLKTINWGKNVKTIGNIAFLGCTALEKVALPESVNTIGNHAFYGCLKLTTVIAEGSINELGRRAFGNDPALRKVFFKGPSMDFEPGAEPFAFDSAELTVYAAPGSTGWTGVADVAGLPADGKWCGVNITYGSPSDADYPSQQQEQPQDPPVDPEDPPVDPEDPPVGPEDPPVDPDEPEELIYELVTKAKMEPLALDLAVLFGDEAAKMKSVAVKGLPSGLAFKGGEVSGTPKKSGVFVATVTLTTTAGKKIDAAITFIVRTAGEHVVVASCDAAMGKVKGSGVYGKGKQVTLKATANKGYVFAGWYQGDVFISDLASIGFAMPDGDVVISAKFVTVEEDRAAIAAHIDALGVDFGEGELKAEVSAMAGVYLEWPVAVEALSDATVKVSGLPSGLKFTAKDIVDRQTGYVTIPANTIYGTPTAASKPGKPSTVKIAVTTAGKTKQEFVLALTVDALPSWAMGVFNGGGDFCQVSLTVAKNGKLSGKLMGDHVTWTLSAADFDGYLEATEDADEALYAMMQAKSGGDIAEILVLIMPDGAAGYIEDEFIFEAFAADWKSGELKATGAKIAKSEPRYWRIGGEQPGTMTFTFGANGVVKVTAQFQTGVKNGMPVYARVTGSAVLCPVWKEDGWYVFRLYVCLAAKGAFDGFAQAFELPWNGSAFVLDED